MVKKKLKNNHLGYCSILENETPAIAFKSTIDFNTQAAVVSESDNEDQHMQDTASVTQAENVDDNSSKELTVNADFSNSSKIDNTEILSTACSISIGMSPNRVFSTVLI